MGALPRARKPLLVLGLLGNLGLLGYFKYANFFLDNLNWLLGTSIGALSLLLPLGISFFTFQQIASEMKMTEFFIAITRPVLSAHLFPMIAFIIVSVLAFMIANAWGVCSLVAPVLLSMGTSAGASPVLIMAAILSGCVFGNHACFYSDTMVLSSQGSGMNNFDHAMSQLPYSLIAVAVSVIGFLILGFIF